MENYDQRRRQQSHDEPGYRSRFGHEDRGDDRERSFESDQPRRAERGWLDYDHDYDRPGGRERAHREEPRYGRAGGSERSRFSPDWSREGEQPRYSDDPYYARNRERNPEEYLRGQGTRSEGRESGDWPYDRSGRDRGRDLERSRQDDEDPHYRGWYSRSTTPFEYPGGSGYLYSESWTLHGPYAGRGPKGYRRSDQQITEEACQRLERDGQIDASEIEVTAEDGVIRLRGTVQDRATKRRAEQCVESVYGARDVMNELRVASSRESSQGAQSGLGLAGSQATAGSQAGRDGMQSQQSPGGGAARAPGMTSSEQAQKH